MSILWDPAEFKSDVDNMFSARDIVPWHGSGAVVTSVKDRFEAQRLSGIEDATLEPVYVSRRGAPQEMVVVPDRRAVMVPSNDQPLQIVSNRFYLLQPSDVFAFADTILHAGDAEYETAGSLKGQRLYWIMLRLDEEIRVGRNGEDVLKPYLFLRDARDGSSAFKWSLVNERVVCRNTWRRATNEGSITSITHRIGAEKRLEKAKEVLLQARLKLQAENDILEALAKAEVDTQMVQSFYKTLLPLPALPDFAGMAGDERVKAEDAYQISRAHVVRDRGMLVNLFENGKGASMAGSTAWGLFNSVTDFVDHFRQPDAKPDTVMFSSMLGVGADLKERAFSLASEAAGVSLN